MHKHPFFSLIPESVIILSGIKNQTQRDFHCYIPKREPRRFMPRLSFGFEVLYQNTKWRSHFVVLKPLQGLVFNSQKCRYTFVNWYYSNFRSKAPQ